MCGGSFCKKDVLFALRYTLGINRGNSILIVAFMAESGSNAVLRCEFSSCNLCNCDKFW